MAGIPCILNKEGKFDWSHIHISSYLGSYLKISIFNNDIKAIRSLILEGVRRLCPKESCDEYD